jgi:hypothetical protein
MNDVYANLRNTTVVSIPGKILRRRRVRLRSGSRMFDMVLGKRQRDSIQR